MGGGYYDRDVGSSSSSDGYNYSDYSTTAHQAMERHEVQADLLPTSRILTCNQKNPVVVAMDVLPAGCRAKNQALCSSESKAF